MLALTGANVTISTSTKSAILNLGLTKSGLRAGAAESVTISCPMVVPMLAVLTASKPASHKLFDGGAPRYRKLFADALRALDLHEWGFRPYSLRRGGATHRFEQSQNLPAVMVAGRWTHEKTARIYINSGLALLATLRLSPLASKSCDQFRRHLLRVANGR